MHFEQARRKRVQDLCIFVACGEWVFLLVTGVLTSMRCSYDHECEKRQPEARFLNRDIVIKRIASQTTEQKGAEPSCCKLDKHCEKESLQLGSDIKESASNWCPPLAMLVCKYSSLQLYCIQQQSNNGSRLESGDFVPLKLSRSADCWPCWRFLACRQEEFSLLHDLLQLIGCSLGFASMMPVFSSLVISRRPCSRGHAASSFNAVTNVL